MTLKRVVAMADENPEYKSEWAMDDFEASYQQALKEQNK
jgi:type VI secretion system secreted protein VgrG